MSMPEKEIIVQAYSAGFESRDYAMILLNGEAVRVKKNENGHYRGLHIVVIDS